MRDLLNRSGVAFLEDGARRSSGRPTGHAWVLMAARN
jgi:hypothetical protein